MHFNAFVLVTSVAQALELADTLGDSSSSTPPFIPVHYGYGGYPRIQTNIRYGAPEQKPSIPTIVDLGSANYWVYGPNATVNYGSTGIGGVGPCNVTASPFYNNIASKTSTKPVHYKRVYSYGGNGKFVSTYYAVNDTLSFVTPNTPALKNQRVALSNFTTVRQAAGKSCKKSDKTFTYDHSILGLSPFKDPTFKTVGPSFREDLLQSGKIRSGSMSVWFDKFDGPIQEQIPGTVLFGAVPDKKAGKYKGDLVKMKLDPPKPYVGYYIPAPTEMSVTSFSKAKKGTTSAKVRISKKAKRCLIDSGTGDDMLPVSQKAFIKATGLSIFHGYPTYDGPCSKLPKDAALNLTFPSYAASSKSSGPKSITISMPLRNYARGNTNFFKGHEEKCSFSLQLLPIDDCVLAAPFSTAMFMAVNDDTNELAIAQGSVSTGADKGTMGLGDVVEIPKGGKIPGVVG